MLCVFHYHKCVFQTMGQNVSMFSTLTPNLIMLFSHYDIIHWQNPRQHRLIYFISYMLSPLHPSLNYSRIKREPLLSSYKKEKKIIFIINQNHRYTTVKRASLLVYPCRFPAVSRLPILKQASYCVLPLKQQPGFPLRLRMLSEPTTFREMIFPFHI